MSFWQLVRHRAQRYQIVISAVYLPIFLIVLAYVALDNLMVDRVILADEKTLPYITGFEWAGPGLLIGALLPNILGLLWQNGTKPIQ